ncbi:MAG: hypothetical protein ACLTDR_00055 [Adlercreutzia equolifaciens]
MEREGRMRPTLARAVRDHEAAGNAVDEAVAESSLGGRRRRGSRHGRRRRRGRHGKRSRRQLVAEAVGEGGRAKPGRSRETQQQKLERIKRELNSVPTQPGVYLVEGRTPARSSTSARPSSCGRACAST